MIGMLWPLPSLMLLGLWCWVLRGQVRVLKYRLALLEDAVDDLEDEHGR